MIKVLRKVTNEKSAAIVAYALQARYGCRFARFEARDTGCDYFEIIVDSDDRDIEPHLPSDDVLEAFQQGALYAACAPDSN